MGSKHTAHGPAGRNIQFVNASQVDGVKEYIDWATSKGFGVMDINVPSYITQDEVNFSVQEKLLSQFDRNADAGSQDMDPYIPRLKERELQQQIESLMCYLWDNYLQLYEAEEIFLMGVGDAYLGVKVLLISRGKSFYVLFWANSSLLTCSRACRLQITPLRRYQLCHRQPPPRKVRRRPRFVDMV